MIHPREEARKGSASMRAPGKTLQDVLRVLDDEGKANPQTDPHVDLALVKRMYIAMRRTRLVDERLVALQRQGRIGFHIGSLGEEASVIGSVAALRPNDWIFPCYREFGALLWRGLSLQRYLDNMYGNANDLAKGRQMPDHYTARQYRYASVSSPIGTQMSHAVGFSLAAKQRGDDIVVVVFLGEGATSSSEFHSAMNFAGVFRTPTVFLLRNNRWAISVPSEKQTASKTFADKGIAYGVPATRCDGNDALAVYRSVSEAVEQAAAGHGPQLVELLTYRMGGHSTSDDPKAYCPEPELEAWRKADPLKRLRAYLEQQQLWTESDEQTLLGTLREEIKQCVEKAESTPLPAIATMFQDVYRELPWHLQEQQARCESAGPPKHNPHGR